jgi:hypothetical protein
MLLPSSNRNAERVCTMRAPCAEPPSPTPPIETVRTECADATAGSAHPLGFGWATRAPLTCTPHPELAIHTEEAPACEHLLTTA